MSRELVQGWARGREHVCRTPLLPLRLDTSLWAHLKTGADRWHLLLLRGSDARDREERQALGTACAAASTGQQPGKRATWGPRADAVVGVAS